MIARPADFYGPDTRNGVPNLLVFKPFAKKQKASWLVNDHILARVSPVPLMVVLQNAWNIWLAPLLIAWCLGWGLVGWLIASLQPDSRAGTTFVAFCA
jgi:hypothetical protein